MMLVPAAAAVFLALVQGVPAAQAPVTRPVAGPVAAPTIPTAGTVTIGAITGEALTEPARVVFRDAVERALAARGFTLLGDPGHGRYVADVTVDRQARGAVSAGRAGGGPPAVSLNGGVSIGLPAGGNRLNDLVVTELTITLSERRVARVVWSGSAVTARVSGTPQGGAALVGQTLADAAMAQFPARTAGPISVP